MNANVISAYSAKTGAIEVTFYAKLDAIPVAEFPAEDVAKLLGSDVTDTVPAYSGTNGGYSILNDYYGTAVVVEVEAGKELDAVAAYIAQIKEAGYTSYKDSEDMFASANGQILVQITKGTIGTMNISFKACPTPTWNGVRAARGIKELFGSEVTLPAYVGGNEYHVDVYDKEIMISIFLNSEDDTVTEVAAYQSVLTEAGFT